MVKHYNLVVNVESRMKLTSYLNHFIDIDIYDGYADFIWSNPKLTKTAYEGLIKDGKKAELKGNVLRQFIDGKTKEEIFEMIKKDIKWNKVKSIGTMKITTEEKLVE